MRLNQDSRLQLKCYSTMESFRNDNEKKVKINLDTEFQTVKMNDQGTSARTTPQSLPPIEYHKKVTFPMEKIKFVDQLNVDLSCLDGI
jgi:hypothetical protein